jgi:F420-non-reducing hydrogenase iron-sulfur subunit
MVLLAFERGAEGVLIMGCKDKECRYGPGPGQAKKIAGSVHGLIHILGLEPERFLILHYAFDEQNRLFEEMESFAEKIHKMKKSPLSAE